MSSPWAKAARRAGVPCEVVEQLREPRARERDERDERARTSRESSSTPVSAIVVVTTRGTVFTSGLREGEARSSLSNKTRGTRGGGEPEGEAQLPSNKTGAKEGT